MQPHPLYELKLAFVTRRAISKSIQKGGSAMNLFGGVVIIGLIVSGVGAVYSFVAVLGLLISELNHR